MISGWNCTPSARPTRNACGPTGPRASSTAPGGITNRSKCHWNHGPAEINSDVPVSEISTASAVLVGRVVSTGRAVVAGRAGPSVPVTSTAIQPISGFGARSTLPPRAVASAWAPKQMPRTGMSAACAVRSRSSSPSIHGPTAARS